MPSNHEILLSCIQTTINILKRIKLLTNKLKQQKRISTNQIIMNDHKIFSIKDQYLAVYNELNDLIDSNVNKSLIERNPAEILRKCMRGLYLEDDVNSSNTCVSFLFDSSDELDFNEHYEEIYEFHSISNDNREWQTPKKINEFKPIDNEERSKKESNKIIIKKNRNQ